MHDGFRAHINARRLRPGDIPNDGNSSSIPDLEGTVQLMSDWGGSFVTVAMALKEMGPFAAVLWRTGLGALTLWLAAAAMRAPLPRDPAFWGACAVMGVLNNVIPFTLMAWGQQSIESGLASILNAATAVFAWAARSSVTAAKRCGPTVGPLMPAW